MKKSDQMIWKSLMMITQVSLSMLTPIFICVIVGQKLDQWFHTSFLFILFLVLGVLSAFRSVYLLTRRFYSKDLEREKKQQQYFEDLKHGKEGEKKDK